MIMKKYIILVLVASAMILNACKKEYEEIGTPSSKIEGVTADWVVTKFVVTDKAGVIEEKLDMTDYFFGATKVPNILFSINGTDTVYTCDTTGLTFNVFKTTSGRWRFDNNLVPTKIVLIPNDAPANIDLTLRGPIRETDTYLKVSIETLCGTKVQFTYDMDFSRRVN
jgi:Domain of unknown function (DUF5004)